MNIANWLAATAAAAPGRPAIMSGETVVRDYRSFFRASAGIAAGLRAHGIEPGDRVGLFMKNDPAYLVALYGIWAAGAAAVPINAKLHPREAVYILDNSETRLCFVNGSLGEDIAGLIDLPLIDVSSDAFAAMTEAEPAAVTPRGFEDLAWLFYTSGTTGKPKGVMITHGMLAATSIGYPTDVDPVDPEDAALYAAPMSHGAGLYAAIHVRFGARHIIPGSGGFDPAEVMELARSIGRISMFMAPTMVRRLTDAAKAAGDRAEGLKTIVYGGGPMYVADITEAVDWFGPKFVQIYGQGECPMAITALSRAEIADRAHPAWPKRIASVGRAQSLVEVRIGDAEGDPLPPGEIGEVMVRGMPVMPGYWKNPDATAKTLRDGWLMTGDVGTMDAEGYLTLQDRSKDVIISGGTNIYPREVEEVLLTHPHVSEVSVVGRPSPEWGEDVVAFIVSIPGQSCDPAELDALCRDQIARFKRPKAYFPVAELPKNNYGKVLKTELRARLAVMEQA